MINNCNFNGRLVADPFYKEYEGGKAVVRFTVASNRNFKNEQQEYDADFIPCYCWDKRAKTYAEKLSKGSLVGIEGSIRSREVLNPETGKKSYPIEIQIKEIDFLSPKPALTGTPFHLAEDPFGSIK